MSLLNIKMSHLCLEINKKYVTKEIGIFTSNVVEGVELQALGPLKSFDALMVYMLYVPVLKDILSAMSLHKVRRADLPFHDNSTSLLKYPLLFVTPPI